MPTTGRRRTRWLLLAVAVGLAMVLPVTFGLWSATHTVASSLAKASMSGARLPTVQPLTPTLSGLALEYRIVQLYSRDAGKREAKISFNVGQGTQDIGYRNDVDVLFTSLPASDVKAASSAASA